MTAPEFSSIPDRQILTAFVYAICGITGVNLEEAE